MSFAMVFPGQGSQSPGMQASLADACPEIRRTYTEASDVLGFDLWQQVQEGPQDALDQTVVTQPAMLAAGVAAWRCWQAAAGPNPVAAAGHSLGEYSALVSAGSLGFADAVRLVRRRAELMQDAVPAGSGAMAAVLGLDDQAVIDVCTAAAEGRVVSAVNFNSPGQVVIAGHRDAVQRAAERAKAAGAKRAMLLNVSVPSHCALMKPAADELAAYLDDTTFGDTAFPVINNVDVEAYAGADRIREGLKRQLYCPVRWVETVQALIREGAQTVVECGPGKVLAGLMRRIDRGVPTAVVDSPDALQAAIAQRGA